MAFFPRFVQNEFAPMFRFIDACDVSTQQRGADASLSSARRTFRPRFDVKENTDSYELQGELPGIETRDVQIEWTDSNTLSIKGRTVRVRNEGTLAASTAIEGAAEQSQITKDAEQDGYRSASVEDESTVSEAGPVTPSQSTEAPVAEHDEQPDQSRWWLNERSVGEFARSFSFPLRIDQDNVLASMDKGVLRILVPKQAPVSKRIEIR